MSHSTQSELTNQLFFNLLTLKLPQLYQNIDFFNLIKKISTMTWCDQLCIKNANDATTLFEQKLKR